MAQCSITVKYSVGNIVIHKEREAKITEIAIKVTATEVTAIYRFQYINSSKLQDTFNWDTEDCLKEI